MSQQKHTPGPYNYGEDRDGWFLESESVKASGQIAYALNEDDARRISACLNACIDLSDDALEGGWTAKGMISYAKSLEQQINALKDETQSQRDKILGLASAQDSEDVFRIIEAMQLSVAHKTAGETP